jgi:hypothetical protein
MNKYKIIFSFLICSGFGLYFLSTKNSPGPLSKSTLVNIKKMDQNSPLILHNRAPSGKSSAKKISKMKGNKNLLKKFASSSHPALDSFKKENINFNELYLIPNLVAEFNPRPYQKITQVGGYSVYEAQSGERNNVIFDSARGLYCAWTGVISLSSYDELVHEIPKQFPLEYLETVGPTHLYKSTNDFDLRTHLPKLLSLEGIGDVNLDLNYAKLEAK